MANRITLPIISKVPNSSTIHGLFRFNDWTKNLLVMAPAFFAQVISASTVIPLLLGFLAFCFMSSTGYMLNDFLDVEYDRKHPEKMNRPYAAGNISAKHLFYLMTVCFSVGIILAALVNLQFLYCSLLYFAITALYSLFLKNIPYIDSLTIVSGFLLRVYAGGAIVHVVVSDWLIAMLVAVTILLAMGKRRNELLLFRTKGIATRKVIGLYNLTVLNAVIGISAIGSIIIYLLYSIHPSIILQFKTDNLVYTTIPVAAGIGRYGFLLFTTDKAVNPATMFVRDLFLCVTFVIWVVLFALFIYG